MAMIYLRLYKNKHLCISQNLVAYINSKFFAFWLKVINKLRTLGLVNVIKEIRRSNQEDLINGLGTRKKI